MRAAWTSTSWSWTRKLEDWWTPPKSDRPLTFIDFAHSEGRFAKQFDKDGRPSTVLLQTEEDRLRNWRMLQELAGLR